MRDLTGHDDAANLALLLSNLGVKLIESVLLGDLLRWERVGRLLLFLLLDGLEIDELDLWCG